MIISNEGRVVMSGTQTDILADFDMVAKSIRK